MELEPLLPSDAQLVAAVRGGAAPAWREIEDRHGGAVHAVAKAQGAKRPRRAAREAMERVRTLLTDAAPVRNDVASVRALRPMLVAELTAGTYDPGDGSELAGDGHALAEGFARLPEAWQTVLWHGVVERRTPAEMTPLVARGANEVVALRRTATTGLHESYLRVIAEHRRAAEECLDVVPSLGAAARGTLAAHDLRAVDAHLADGRDGAPCTECQARLDLAATVEDRLPPAIVPGITRLDDDRYRAAVGGGGRAFGSDALDATKSDRVRRLAAASAAVAILLALVGAVLLIRRPFEGSFSVATVEGSGTTSAPVVTGEPGPPPTSEATAPTTTELLLRPAPSGPKHTVELVFVPAGEAQGLLTPVPDVTVGLSAPAPIFAGGTGTVDISLTGGADDVNLAFEVREPRGLLLDALVDGEAECVDREEAAPLCTVALDAGETVELALRFRLENSVVGRLVVESELARQPLEVAIDATPRLLHSSVGRGDVMMIGNTVMTCAPSAPPCAEARTGSGDLVDRWDLAPAFVGAGPDAANSSAATLELPSTSSVMAAYLLWSGDLSQNGEQIPSDSRHERVVLSVPGGDQPIVVEADRTALGDVDATQYLAVADVTALVAAAGPGTYGVGDVQTVEVRGSYGGWSLVVVTADDEAPRRQMVVTFPFAWFAPGDDYVAAIPVPAAGPTPGSIDVLAFEGEPGFLPEGLAAGATALGGSNPFDSSIDGPRDPSYVNNFGVDLDTYDLTIDEPDGSLTLHAESAKDGVRLAVIGLAVDLSS